MKIKELPKGGRIHGQDIIPYERMYDYGDGFGAAKTRGMHVSQIAQDMKEMMRLEYAYKSIYAGRNLGDEFSYYDSYYLGDYWTDTAQSITWRVVDFNYWWDYRQIQHIVVMPDYGIFGNVNATRNLSGGYKDATVRYETLQTWKQKIKNFFGEDSIYAHNEYLSNAVNDAGVVTGIVGEDSEVELPNEAMIFGSRFIEKIDCGGILLPQPNTQLSLFQVFPQFIYYDEQYYGLRDISDINHFSKVSGMGDVYTQDPLNGCYIRPVFGIKVEWTGDEPW